jgi:hypothetical protein
LSAGQDGTAPSLSSGSRRNAVILGLVFCCPLLAISILFYFRSSQRRAVIADPAIYAAQTSDELIEKLGEPMRAGKPVGQFVSKGGNGNADLEIPLEGPRARGALLEWAQQERGQWHLCGLDFKPEHGESVTLVDEAKTHCEPE